MRLSNRLSVLVAWTVSKDRSWRSQYELPWIAPGEFYPQDRFVVRESRTMKTFVVLASATLSALVLASSAQAQSATPTRPDAARLELAREILTANGGAQAMEARMRALFASIATLTKSALPNADPKASELSQVLMKYMADEEIKAIPQLIDQTAIVYANNLSEGELRDMLAWSVSPSAQAIRAKMPVITEQLMAEQGPLLKKMMAGAMTTAVDRACAEAKCTDDQRRTMTSIAQRSMPAS